MAISSSTTAKELTLEWDCLPEHILDIIINKLVSLVDYIRFSLVCKRWHYVACHMENKSRRIITSLSQALPFLLLLSQREDVEQLFHFTKNKVYDFKLNLPPNITNRRVTSSSHDWLIFVEKGFIVTLFNPFSCKTIRLPAVSPASLSYFEENHENEEDYRFWIHKAVLSRDPLLYPESFEVAVIFSDMHRLGLYQSSKNSWTCDLTDHLEYPQFEDVIYYNDKFYAVDYFAGLTTINSNSTDPPWLDPVVERKPLLDDMLLSYIVSTTNGDLLLIRRILETIWPHDVGEHQTRDFKIYKLRCPAEGMNDEQQQRADWVEIDSIGTEALFLGNNQSMSISTLYFSACKPNSIYYTDNGCHVLFSRDHKSYDMGIFELEKRSFSQRYLADSDRMWPPVWILATLEGDH